MSWISLFLIGFVSLAVIIASIKRMPDLGVLLALVVIAITLWLRPGGLEQIGFKSIENWFKTLILYILLGGLTSILSVGFLEPLIERWVGRPIDLSIVDYARGNRKALLQLLALVWILVALLEEMVFRGFLMTEFSQLLGTSIALLVANLLITSALFGLAHWYQGPSGVLLTGVVGLLLGGVFILSDFNLWHPILLHGFIDTVSLVLLYLNLDRRLKNLLFKIPENKNSIEDPRYRPSEQPHE